MAGFPVTEEQRDKLAALRKHITVAMDDDEPGRAATERLRRDLAGLRCDFFPVPRPYKDFGDTPVATLRDAIAKR
jgi:hypothetical protein